MCEKCGLKGVKLGKIRIPTPGVEVVDVEDPEGNLFSLESLMTVLPSSEAHPR